MTRAVLAAFALSLLAGAAQAQQTIVRYACNINGLRGDLTAQIEVLGGAGITTDGRGNISGVIGGQGGTTYVSGELRTPTTYYTFRGENAYADFTDHTNGGRFTVEWVPQQGGLVVIVNPFERAGPRSQFSCRQTR